MESPVLVVGAGPVGLTAAVMLARHGTPLRIIDAGDGPTTLSRALVLWRRTMQVLDPVLPWEQVLEGHARFEQACFFDAGRAIAEIDLATPGHALPPGVFIPQCDTEGLLIDVLESMGVHVERDSRLVEFTAHDDRVECTLERGEHLQTPWLIGCDGAHSAVRHGLGVEFPGETVDHQWLLADVSVEGEQPAGSAIMEGSSEGPVALFPVGEDRWRVMADCGLVNDQVSEGPPTKDDVQRVLDSRTARGWRVREALWLGRFHVNERQVERYVHGRVLMAGDAAHVHSPAGGQGMNTGMQDAVNLAWKVALVQRGAAHPGLLETYQAERHPVGAAVVKYTSRMLKAAMVTNPIVRSLRGVAMHLALAVPAVQRAMASALAEDVVHCRDGPLARQPYAGTLRPGDAFPDVPMDGGSSTDVLRGNEATVVTSDASAVLPGEFPSGGFPVAPREAPAVLADRLGDDDAVLVRPDGVMAASGSASISSWLDALSTRTDWTS